MDGGVMLLRGLAVAVPIALGGCAASVAAPPDPAATAPPASTWRAIATPHDRDRLRRWRGAWVESLARARRQRAPIDADAAFFAFDTVLSAPVPPAGDYRCRVIKLGARVPGLPDYVAYPFFTCRVDVQGGVPTLARVTGSQRPAGRIYADTTGRAVFLGTMVLGDEVRAIAYGRDPTRDLAGWVERIGPARWRIAFPYPAYESTLDVVDLVPAR